MIFCGKKKYRVLLGGFTLIEVIVSLFVFTLAMASVTQIFGSAFSGYRATRNVEQDIENIQYTINIMAKELRTSSVVSASGSQQSVKFFDHSQGRCFRYRIRVAERDLQVASAASTGVADCNGLNPAAFATISTGTVTGSFQVTPSAAIGGPATRVGKVTIAFQIAEDATHFARIQTTVSLRDFGNIGL